MYSQFIDIIVYIWTPNCKYPVLYTKCILLFTNHVLHTSTQRYTNRLTQVTSQLLRTQIFWVYFLYFILNFSWETVSLFIVTDNFSLLEKNQAKQHFLKCSGHSSLPCVTVKIHLVVTMWLPNYFKKRYWTGVPNKMKHEYTIFMSV